MLPLLNDYNKGRIAGIGEGLAMALESEDTPAAEPKEAKEYHQIVVADDKSKPVAVITDDSVVEHDGYRVLLS